MALLTLVIWAILQGLFATVHTRHQDLRRDLASVKDLIASIERMLDNSLSDYGKRIHTVEVTLTSLLSKVTDLGRKSQLLGAIYEESDARKEVLLRILRSVEEIGRKEKGLQNNGAEVERVAKLSDNVQAFFQILGGMNRKIDDLQTRLERMPGACPTNDLKFFITKKIDSLSSSTALLSECDSESLKEALHSSLRQPLDNIAKRCGTGDWERSAGRMFESKWKNLADSIQSLVHTKLDGFNAKLDESFRECRQLNDRYSKLHVHDIAYLHDTAHELRAAPKEETSPPKETPGRIFRRLWRKMTEPINKVGEKIEALAQTIEESNKKYHNETVSKIKEMAGAGAGAGAGGGGGGGGGRERTKGSQCPTQIQAILNATKETAEKIFYMENRQMNMQNSVAKILSEVERVKSTIQVGNSAFIPSVTEAYVDGPGEGYLALSCADLQTQGVTRSGIFSLKPKGAKEPFNAYCDLETEGGGWTVLQRRGNFGEEFRQNFTQNWDLYKDGFGDQMREFWMGNEKMHLLSAQEDVKLRVELDDFDGNSSFAEYSKFRVEDENNQFRLHVGEYYGNATDSLSLHDGKMFSTHDKDNDEVASCCNCADTFKGGWWYYRCFEANLNGPYHTDPTANGYFLGIIWERWKGDYSLKASEMKIRPLAFDEFQDP